MIRALVVIAVIAVVTVGGLAFFWWAGRATKKQHARFTRRDVLAALENAIQSNTYYDEWELFLAWQIDDPYLESIRQRCLPLAEWDPGDELTARVNPILDELRTGVNGVR